MPKISELPAATALAGTEPAIVIQGGVTKRSTSLEVKNSVRTAENLPENVKEVFVAADLATIPDNTTFIIKNTITLETGMVFPANTNVAFVSPGLNIVNSIIFTGAAATFITVTSLTQAFFKNIRFIDGTGTNKFCSVVSTNPAKHAMLFRGCEQIGWDDLGDYTAVLADFRDHAWLDYTKGAIYTAANIFMGDFTHANTVPHSRSFVTYINTDQAPTSTVQFGCTSGFMLALAGESLFNIRPTANVLLNIFGCSNTIAGGKYFFTDAAETITSFTDGGGGTTLVTTPDASALDPTGEVLIKGQNLYQGGHIATFVSATTYTIPVAFDSDTGTTGTWINGSIDGCDKRVNVTGNLAQRNSASVCDVYTDMDIVIPVSTPAATTIIGGTWIDETLERTDFQSEAPGIAESSCTIIVSTEQPQLWRLVSTAAFTKGGGATDITFFFIINGVEQIARATMLTGVTEGQLNILMTTELNATDTIKLGIRVGNGNEVTLTSTTSIYQRIA